MGSGGGAWGGGQALAGEMSVNNLSLSTLNSTVKYDLKNELKLFFGDDNEENIFMPDILNHNITTKTTFPIILNRMIVYLLALMYVV